MQMQRCMNPLASKLFVSVVVMLEAAAISPRMSLVLLVLLVGAASAQFSSSSDYCRFSGKHTMCRYKGVAPECSHHHDREDILTIMILMTVIMMMRVIMRGEDAGYRGVSDADIKEILEYHNRSGHSLDKCGASNLIYWRFISENKSNLFYFKASHLPAQRWSWSIKPEMKS